jgi:hypothetical protein
MHNEMQVCVVAACIGLGLPLAIAVFPQVHVQNSVKEALRG